MLFTIQAPDFAEVKSTTDVGGNHRGQRVLESRRAQKRQLSTVGALSPVTAPHSCSLRLLVMAGISNPRNDAR
jgi:hypothetical protein